ncbi:methyltransferase domain-containing protein [Actinobacillus equuli]|uniref:methyltransferase domain-containing protein n=1 Tax=Actinobacillus equuli TaxID=718 RepID=UPI002441CD57|nr:methyltransferase domain-containing protein [Actinobacillus equuli]WGE41743.1 methyltransferase domain-containing protein [Actinobacillus equuli subsp. haemolyticus]WGE46108.1 methyltransferase domain-containing protein [Actinobacillus equuli subsp. haemolyticus]WGE52463.1 methyltransferase domain-containing protein [Actinobacillus equuli subsp. haemolyticus]WGE58711.1 methyltransferase domain-containing protein [Actinobacillus equuli subsp. haemolyticus]WGE60697.1 methyltransferase domain-
MMNAYPIVDNTTACIIKHYESYAVAQKTINTKLIELLKINTPKHFNKVLEIGCGTGLFTAEFLANFSINHLVLNDLYEDYQPYVTEKLQRNFTLMKSEFVFGDCLNTPLGDGYDLLAAASVVEYLPCAQTFVQCAKAKLKQGGYLLFNSVNPQHFHEIRALVGEGGDYPSLLDWINQLEVDFEILSIEQDGLCFLFESPEEVITHLEYTGISPLKTVQWTEDFYQEFIRQYKLQFSQEGCVSLTYQPFYILARKR